MLRRFDITRFGTFNNFAWTSVTDDKGAVKEFADFNVIYGRNYTGKTTLSRIARFLETKTLPTNYAGVDFSISLDGGGTISHLGPVPPDIHVRVYNKDFVHEHLRFLRDDDGEIRPIAILGKGNKEITEQIDALTAQLGKEEGPGLLHDLATAIASVAKANGDSTKAKQAVTKSLTSKANDKPNGMKHNARCGDAYYDISKLKNDLDAVSKANTKPVDDKRKKELEAQCDAQALDEPKRPPPYSRKFASLAATATELITRIIEPTAAIKELLKDAALHKWVKEGISLHEHKRDTCGFCSQPLPHDLWKRLKAHYNKASEELEADIDTCISSLSAESTAVYALGKHGPLTAYDAIKSDLAESLAKLNSTCNEQLASIEALSEALRARKRDIFNALGKPIVEDKSTDIAAAVAVVNAVIDKHAKKTMSLETDRAAARKELRLSEVAAYAKDLQPLKDREFETATILEQAEESRNLVQDEVTKASERIATLSAQLKDEGLGAERVNKYLKSSFGQIDLQLVAKQNADKKYTFNVCRGAETAYNMSEGECSLLAFCYFLAKLDDVESDGKPLIVWIDDPISSLDANHVFFVHGLIEGRLARPIKDSNGVNTYRYRQIFLATHSLEFLRYVRKLSHPSKEDRLGFFVVARSTGGSTLRVMQPHLRKYVTEFHYLFSEIAFCATPGADVDDPYAFYSFGNHLRRFLESFLFYKYPFSGNTVKSDGEVNSRVKMFFQEDGGADAIVARLMNEQSHTMGALEMVAEPIDNAEIALVARHVLKKLRDNDKIQYEHLIECTGKPDPLAGII